MDGRSPKGGREGDKDPALWLWAHMTDPERPGRWRSQSLERVCFGSSRPCWKDKPVPTEGGGIWRTCSAGIQGSVEMGRTPHEYPNLCTCSVRIKCLVAVPGWQYVLNKLPSFPAPPQTTVGEDRQRSWWGSSVNGRGLRLRL